MKRIRFTVDATGIIAIVKFITDSLNSGIIDNDTARALVETIRADMNKWVKLERSEENEVQLEVVNLTDSDV